MSTGLYRRTGSAGMVLAVLLLGAATPVAFADSAFDGMSASPVWGNFQWGLAFVQRHGQALRELDSSSQYWRIEGGMRLNKEWMVGIGTQHIPLAYYNRLRQLYGTVVFNPDRGPWLYEAGLGKAKYKATYDGGGFPLYEKHSGLAVNLGVGFDWTPKIEDAHFGVRATWEYSALGHADLGPGTLNHSRISVGASASFY
jgi:hypothetical protein